MEKKQPHAQFVVQEHQTPDGVHWDLMLRHGDTLWTWRIGIHPKNLSQPVPAERIADHPLKFLTYEGPVQHGTAGVHIVDRGALQLERVDAEMIISEFTGQILQGKYALQHQNGPFWFFFPIEPEKDRHD